MIEQQRKEGWRLVKFGDLAENVNDRVEDPRSAGVSRYVGLEHLDADNLRICRWGAPTDVEATKLRFRVGDIIFGRRRAYQRKLAIADFDGICSAHAMVLRERPGSVDPGFLPFFMQSDVFMNRAIAISVGSLSPTINWTSLREEQFAVPPIQEQRRAVLALTAMDTLIGTLKESANTLSRVRSATIDGFFLQAQHCGNVIPLVEGCLRVTDGTHQPPTFTQEGIPFFLVKTISSGRIDWGHTKFVSQQTYDELTRRVVPKRGDVLYTAVGATYGIAHLVDFDTPFVFQRHIAHIIPNPMKFDGRYLELFLNSRIGKRQSDQAAIGSAQPTVTLGSLSKFRVPCPLLEEQKDLTAQAEAINKALQQIARRAAQLVIVRRMILGGVSS